MYSAGYTDPGSSHVDPLIWFDVFVEKGQSLT